MKNLFITSIFILWLTPLFAEIIEVDSQSKLDDALKKHSISIVEFNNQSSTSFKNLEAKYPTIGFIKVNVSAMKDPQLKAIKNRYELKRFPTTIRFNDISPDKLHNRYEEKISDAVVERMIASKS